MSARHGSRPARAAEGLYAPLDWAVLRAPLLPAGAAAASAPRNEDSLLPEDSRLRAAIAVASTDLAGALTRTPCAHPRAARLRGKLLRYQIRMSTRPTPYGLFAGVGLVQWGSKTEVRLTGEPPATRTRPDMEWLLDFVAALERDPRVRACLRLVTNSVVVVRGGRAFASSSIPEPVLAVDISR